MSVVKKEHVSGFSFAVFVAGAFAVGAFSLPHALSRLETLPAREVMKGKWSPLFEKGFGEELPVSTPSRDLWGGAEYALFRQGRRGVVVGENGWLFTAEEFSCPPEAERNLAENFAYINDTRRALDRKGARLAIVLVPAKARVYQAHTRLQLPGCRQRLYATALRRLGESRIATADVLSLMDSALPPDELYLKKDTHWSQNGSRLAAQALADLVHAAFRDMVLPPGRFVSIAGAQKEHDGDLMSYLPGVSLPPDAFTAYSTGNSVAVAGAGNMQGLLGDDAPPLVTLVGTSYSANPNWNFAGFLKEALRTDVLNMADEGLGPFVVMDKYLQGKAWRDNPPRLLVWEIPERFLLMPHGVAQ